jgi:hypothetical protein
MDYFNKDDKYYRAKEKLQEIKKFYMSLLSFTLFIIFLGALNYYTNEWRNPWFLWAAFGWGIGLFFQAAKAFDLINMFGKDWEARKMKEFMDNDSEDEDDKEPKVNF